MLINYYFYMLYLLPSRAKSIKKITKIVFKATYSPLTQKLNHIPTAIKLVHSLLLLVIIIYKYYNNLININAYIIMKS